MNEMYKVTITISYYLKDKEGEAQEVNWHT